MDSKELRGLMEAYSEVYAPQEVDEATAVASPAPGGRGRKNSYTKEIRTGASTKTSSKYSNVSDAKERMKTPLSRYDTPKMQLKKEEYVDEADSLAAMQARREKRLAAQRKREGTTAAGKDFGHNYWQTAAQRKADQDAEYKAGMKKEEVDIFDTVLEFLQTEGFAETLEEAKWIMANELDEEDIDEIIEAYVDYRKGKLPSGRTPQTALKSGVERAKVNASREQRAGGSFGTTATPSWERSKKAGAVGDEMDANTSFGGKVNKVVNLGRRDNAGPSVQRGEPNTARHQQAIDARAKKA